MPINQSNPGQIPTVQLKITPEDMGIKTAMIANIPISSISWRDFKGEIPENKKYFAHINWHITYRYFIQRKQEKQVRVLVKPHISSKSWADPRHFSDYQLLKHEYGHYLICCLCCLNFQKKINEANSILLQCKSIKEMQMKIQTIFNENLKQYLELQVKYDQQTNHYYQQEKQKQWEQKIVKQINGFYRAPIRIRKYSSNREELSLNKNISSKQKDIKREIASKKEMFKLRDGNSIEKINQSQLKKPRMKSEGKSHELIKKPMPASQNCIPNAPKDRKRSALPPLRPKIYKQKSKQGLSMPIIQPTINIR